MLQRIKRIVYEMGHAPRERAEVGGGGGAESQSAGGGRTLTAERAVTVGDEERQPRCRR